MANHSAAKKKFPLHLKILIGMVAGILFGIGMCSVDGGKEVIMSLIKPFGTIFVNLLKLIAIPLIVASLIKGISDLKDISKNLLNGKEWEGKGRGRRGREPQSLRLAI